MAAPSALSWAFMAKHVFNTTRIAAGVSFNGPFEAGTNMGARWGLNTTLGLAVKNTIICSRGASALVWEERCMQQA
jgi:hypothetical protein